MTEVVLKALERTENPKKVRAAGFIPGVLNGPGTTSVSVKFEPAPLKKIIAQHGKNAKMWVELGEEKKFGFINEIQRHPVEGNILHVAVHLVSQEQEVKMQLPIAFHGQEQLDHNMLYLQICKSDVEVLGQTGSMPDSIAVDISEKGAGEMITAADLKLPQEIKILDPENEVYAVIKGKHEEVEEAPAEEKPAE